MVKKDFTTLIGRRFWTHIHKETDLPHLVPHKLSSRQKFLEDLFEKIASMKYSPSPPRGIIVSHKEKLVARFVPALTVEDYCVYFYCIRSIEDFIAQNRVSGTYGGYKLGGKIRAMESSDSFPFSAPDNSYNKYAWLREWKEFQKKVFLFYKRTNYKYFIYFDIANFYDSINLERLEMLTRHAVPKEKHQQVNLLFYFLKHWNKQYLFYERQNVGLPQDEVGDCSRILANFYLQDYDRKVKKIVELSGAGYLRYADDQIIGASTEAKAKRLMFLASKELARIGLNINASKAKVFSREQLFKYWSFDIFKLLGDKNNSSDIEKAFKIFEKRISENERIREDAILRRFFSCNLKKVSFETRVKLLKYAFSEEFLVRATPYSLGRVYDLLDRIGKKEFLESLNIISGTILFNHFHLKVIKFAKEKKIPMANLKRLVRRLNKINTL